MAGIFLFTGENTFSLHAELKRWKENFQLKYGDTNLHTVAGRECVWSDLLDEAQSQPFLGGKRLIIVDELPASITKDEMKTLAGTMHQDTLIVFVSPNINKKKGGAKMLLRIATVKTFNTLMRRDLIKWVMELAAKHNAKLSKEVAERLISVVGKNQWHLQNECLKLLAFTSNRNGSPRVADVKQACLPGEKHTVWILSGLIGKGSAYEAVSYSRHLHESGEDAMRLWNLYLWVIVNLVQIWMYKKEKNLAPYAISKEAGIAMPSVQALLPCADMLTSEQICSIVDHAIEADHAVKTGKIKFSASEPVELVTLLEREILRIPSRKSLQG